MPFCSKKGSAYGTSDREEYMEKKTTALGTVNNEVDFCKVYDMGTKEQIERILLANRISYSCRFDFFQNCLESGKRLFAPSGFTMRKCRVPRGW